VTVLSYSSRGTNISGAREIETIYLKKGDKMSIIRIEDSNGNLMKMFIFTDDKEDKTYTIDEDDGTMINDPDDGSWVGR